MSLLKEVLHLYSGCYCLDKKRGTATYLEAVYNMSPELPVIFCGNEKIDWQYVEENIRPILRPINSLTTKDWARVKESSSIATWDEITDEEIFEVKLKTEALKTKKLLEMRVDLFGLIEAGLAEKSK